MELVGGFAVGRVRFFRRFKISEVNTMAVGLDGSGPTAMLLVTVDTSKASAVGVVAIDRVLSIRRGPQVGPTVVDPNAVDVIQLIERPLPSHHQPREPMR